MTLAPSAQKVQDQLKSLGFEHQVVELPESTRSAAEAAQAVGCTVDQIAKSLIFETANTHHPVLVIASGSNRVDENRVGELVGEAIRKASAEFVRQHTGFAIGGVPPLGHLEPIETYIDEDLLAKERIWAAAGAPRAVFQLAPSELVEMTGGKVARVKLARAG